MYIIQSNIGSEVKYILDKEVPCVIFPMFFIKDNSMDVFIHYIELRHAEYMGNLFRA